MHRSRIRILAVGFVHGPCGRGRLRSGHGGPLDNGPAGVVPGASPIAACEGDTGFRDVGGVPATQSVNSEVEPHAMVDPSNPDMMIGAWQQDRWNNGGSEGNVTATSMNGGATWTINAQTKSSNCTGGTPANGGTSSGPPTRGSPSPRTGPRT